MKRHPRLITALGVIVLLLAFTVPAALAKSNPPGFPGGGNCGKGKCKTTTTIINTSTVTGTTVVTTTRTTGTVTYPPDVTTIVNTTTVFDTTTAGVKNCPQVGTQAPHPPPCGKNKSADLGSGSGISVGAVLAVLGSLFLGYLWIHRRRTLDLED